jgi:pimeloyl-ACP methyl ester carboxylesterase
VDRTGAGATIVFAHANGFPARSYEQVFAVWRDAGFAVHAIEKIGHDPRFPVTSNWPRLRDELIDFIERQAAAPAFLVGHSLGGYLSLLAAARRPDLARGVVLLDSPILGGWKARTVQVAKTTGIVGRFSPGHVSKRRREHWPSAAAAHEHFAAKKAFAAFAPGVLANYIESGVEAEAKGVRLAFRREVETAIYNTLPHDLQRVLRLHPLRCPLAFVGGSDSAEVRRLGLAATGRIAHGRVSRIEGTHLFPLERPAETARAVLGWIDAFGAERHAA